VWGGGGQEEKLEILGDEAEDKGLGQIRETLKDKGI
jgi:hypothetical protein